MHGWLVAELGLDIVSGMLRPGDALPPEPVLCEQLGVSRGGLREAVKALAAKGLVELRPRTGTRVRPESEWNLLDKDVLGWLCHADRDGLITQLTEVRELIEPGAAALAAARATESEHAQLLAAYEAMAASASDPRPERFTEADIVFHRLVLRLSHNPLLSALSAPFELALHTTFAITATAPDAITETLPLHRDVVDAIGTSNCAAAEAAMRRLIMTSASNFHTARNSAKPRHGRGRR